MNQDELIAKFDELIDKLQTLFEDLRGQMNKALDTRNALVSARQKILVGCTAEELTALLEIAENAARS
jgi:hypothetical protein